VLGRIARVQLWIAASLAAIVVSTGLIWSTRVAAGADAYGYVSQADLWLRWPPSVLHARDPGNRRAVRAG